MSKWTRRELVKLGVAASAGTLTAGTLPSAAQSTAHAPHHAAEANATQRSASSLTSFARERLSLDRGWRFALGNACDASKDFGFGEKTGTFAKSGNAGPVTGEHAKQPFDESAWKQVDLPHDWAVDLPFALDEALLSHGCKPLGRKYPETSIGWYRRTFHVPAEDAGRRLSIDFDGVYRNATVFLNGHYLGQNFSGYAPFSYDVTDFLDYGKDNVLAVRVDATVDEGWFYEGAGIYRHVWLTKTAPVHFVQHGNFIQSRLKSGVHGPATLDLTSELVNETDALARCVVSATVLDPTGQTVATMQSTPLELAPGASGTARLHAELRNPKLWDLEHPHLYGLAATLHVGNASVDQDHVTFGIRSIRFDVDRGFLLNEQPVKIKGTCNHQDHAGLGAALPDRMQSYRIALLKQLGSNAYRTSHNCPTAELLDACDRQGMLVMDETRMFSSSPEGLSELERMVRRDRNHPSVILWSIANEEPQQGSARGARMGATMKQLVRRLDPTRMITAAMNNQWGKGLSDVVDVQGFNYRTGEIDAYRKAHPHQPLIGTEVASTVSTRGIYANDPERGFVSAYDTEKPHWGNTAEEWWSFYNERPWLSGGFVWTGFDYRGEPTPYKLPCISSHFGLLDTCGFPKDNAFYYKAWWSNEPVLHVFPHWNWPGKEGQEIEVWAYSNQQSVELLLNGKSLGSQPVRKDSHLVWKVPYAPGVLEARASRDGRVTLTEKRETTGAPARILLEPQMDTISADGEDLSVVHIRIVDAQNRTVPLAENLVQFAVRGPGKIIGVGNGNPSSHEADHAEERKAFNGLCMCIVQAGTTSGPMTLTAKADGLTAAECSIEVTAATRRPSVA